MYDSIVKITKKNTPTQNDFTEIDINDLTGHDVGTVVVEEYHCTITERITYKAGQQGDNFEGKAVMKGEINLNLKEGHIVDGQYKIVGKPKTVRKKHTICNLVRL